MRHLRRYNEEIEPSTLRRAATELNKKGWYHRDRAIEMEEYAGFVEWKRLRDRCKSAGVIKVRLQTEEKRGSVTQEDYVGDFYPVVSLGLDLFADEMHNYMVEDQRNNFVITLHWFVSATPTTEEGYEKAHAMSKLSYNFKYGSRASKYVKESSFPLAFFHFDIEFDGGSYRFGKPHFYHRDDMQVGAVLVDRAGSGKVRAEILRQLSPDYSDPCTIYLGGERHDFSNPRDAFDGMLQFYGLGTDYGLETQAVYDYVKKLPGNYFTI